MSQKGVFFVMSKEIGPVVSFRKADRNLFAGNLGNMAFFGSQVIVGMKLYFNTRTSLGSITGMY